MRVSLGMFLVAVAGLVTAYVMGGLPALIIVTFIAFVLLNA